MRIKRLERTTDELTSKFDVAQIAQHFASSKVHLPTYLGLRVNIYQYGGMSTDQITRIETGISNYAYIRVVS